MNIHVYIHDERQTALLEQIAAQLTRIERQGTMTDAKVDKVLQLAKDIDAETNAVAAKVDAEQAAIKALQDQLAAGGTIKPEDLDPIIDSLGATSARLQTIGADPTAIIPPPV